MVNTFMPLPDVQASLATLDYRRLGKQRVEAWQILQANLGLTKGWRNHPAAIMWRDHSAALCEYGIESCRQWIARGYNDSMLDRFLSLRDPLGAAVLPRWVGSDALHRSHQSNLLRKDPEHYSQFGWDVPSDLPYVWADAYSTPVK